TENNCFFVGNLKFPVTGIWELAIWDQNNEITTLPLVVSNKKFDLHNDINRPIVQVWVPSKHEKQQAEAWLFCGKRKVNHIYLYHPETQTKVYKQRLKEFGGDCRIFTK